MTDEIKQVAEAIIPEDFKRLKFFALMLFNRVLNRVTGNMDWVNTHNILYDDYAAALDAYANTPCPASQLIEAETKEELEKKMEQMQKNFKDEKWLDEYLYPYL